MIKPTDQQVAEILRRSSEGESVARVIRMMDMDQDETLEYLRQHHNDEVKAAKEKFRKSKREHL